MCIASPKANLSGEGQQIKLKVKADEGAAVMISKTFAFNKQKDRNHTNQGLFDPMFLLCQPQKQVLGNKT